MSCSPPARRWPAFARAWCSAAWCRASKIENGAYAGGPFDWATPFGLLCGLGVVAGYALLGATWLMMKTDGDMARRAAAKAKVLLVAVLVFMAAVSLYTPLPCRASRSAGSRCRIFFICAPVPIVTALVAFAHWRWIEARREVAPFLASIALFLLGYLGLVDFDLSLYRAADADDLGSRRRAVEPDLHADRHVGAAAAASSATPRSPIGCSAARCARARRITDRHRDERSVSATDATCALPPATLPGLITPQPIRNIGSRPCTGRSKARGTSGTRSGKYALMSGGGVGVVSARARPRPRPSCGCRRR